MNVGFSLLPPFPYTQTLWDVNLRWRSWGGGCTASCWLTSHTAGLWVKVLGLVSSLCVCVYVCVCVCACVRVWTMRKYIVSAWQWQMRTDTHNYFKLHHQRTTSKFLITQQLLQTKSNTFQTRLPVLQSFKETWLESAECGPFPGFH